MTRRGAARARLSAVVGVALLLTGSGSLGADVASAADVVPVDPAVGGTFYLANGNDGTDYPVGASIGWNDPVVALPAPGDMQNRLVAPPGTESVVTFVGPQGGESDPTTWNATAPWELTAPGQWLADITPYHLITPGPGSPSGTNAVAAVSGDYSLGVAYLKDGGLHVVPGGLYFVHIHLTGNADPEQASYTWQPVEATGPATAPSPTPAGGTVTSQADVLSFVAPATPGASDVLGTLTVGSGSAATGWTVTVSTGGDTRTLATGSGEGSIDTTGATSGGGATTVVLTLVAG